MAERSVWLARDNSMNNGATTYLMPFGSNQSWDTEAKNSQIMPIAGTLTSFKVKLDVAPGIGKSWVISLRINGVVTLATFTISNTDVEGSWTGSISFSANDLVSIEATPVSSPTANHFRSYIIASADKVIILGGIAVDAADNTFQILQGDGTNAWAGLEASVAALIGAAGTLSDFVVQLSNAPGASNTRAVAVRVDFSSSALNISFGAADTILTDTSTVAVTAGQNVNIRHDSTGTPTACTWFRWSCTLVPTTSGEIPLLRSEFDDLHTTTTEYNYPQGYNKTWTSDATVRRLMLPECTITKWYVELQNAPGAAASGDKFNFTLQLDGSDTLKTIEILETATTGNDTSNSISVTDEQLLGIKSVPTSSPTVGNFYSGIVITLPAASSSSSSCRSSSSSSSSSSKSSSSSSSRSSSSSSSSRSSSSSSSCRSSSSSSFSSSSSSSSRSSSSSSSSKSSSSSSSKSSSSSRSSSSSSSSISSSSSRSSSSSSSFGRVFTLPLLGVG